MHGTLSALALAIVETCNKIWIDKKPFYLQIKYRTLNTTKGETCIEEQKIALKSGIGKNKTS